MWATGGVEYVYHQEPAAWAPQCGPEADRGCIAEAAKTVGENTALHHERRVKQGACWYRELVSAFAIITTGGVILRVSAVQQRGRGSRLQHRHPSIGATFLATVVQYPSSGETGQQRNNTSSSRW